MKFFLLLKLHLLFTKRCCTKTLCAIWKNWQGRDGTEKIVYLTKVLKQWFYWTKGKIIIHESSEAGISFKVRMNWRTRIKIFNEKGLRYANITVPFYSHDNTERITSVKPVFYNASDNGSKYQNWWRKTFYERKIDNFYSEIIAALPGVKVGSVIEYAYKMEIADMAGLKDWFSRNHSGKNQPLPVYHTANFPLHS